MKKNVIIISARRSGTHLLTDLIVNNFGYKSINYNYIDYTKFGWPELNGLETLMNEGNKVTWTHSHDFKDYLKYKHSEEDNDKLNKYFQESKIILIYRDIRDIINSCYHRPRYKSKYKDFTDFYNNFNFDGYELIDQNYDSITDLLIEYYKNWFSVYMSKELLGLDMEIISYEDIITKYEQSVYKISSFLEHPIDNVVDVRLPLKDKNITLTTNDFRTGKIGEWVHTLGKRLGEKIHKKYNIDLGIGFNYFLNDTKMHKYHIPEKRKLYKTNWKSRLETVDKQLASYSNKFLGLDEWVNNLVANRYNTCTHRGTDLRYKHKVFYYDEYILKFVSPIKTAVDKSVYDGVATILSKELLLTVYKTDDILYSNGIVPKLIYAGIYKGSLCIIQERCPSSDVLCSKYNLYPQADDWSWPVKLGLHNKIKSHFDSALKHNILLTDIVSVYNSAITVSGELKYFDLDGIKHFDSREEMLKSQDYKNAMGIFNEINKNNIFININK